MKTYHQLIIQANNSTTEIWLGDDKGFLVEKATGDLNINLLPGNYFVNFGKENIKYLIKLEKSIQYTETDFLTHKK